MIGTWALLVGLTALSVAGSTLGLADGPAALLLAVTWLKMRLVLVRFVGVAGGWRTGLSVGFALFLALLLLPVWIAQNPYKH